ncbi:MAG: TetR/AcrR family transcriptional regulator [Clostridiales bacterium]|nr:TetR/AcrR family transcriptional regulator [Clostridiales bacterium]
MANHKPGKHHEQLRKRVLFVSAQRFLAQGYTNTTMRQIASDAGLSTGSVVNLFGSKEGILCGLVEFVIDAQFQMTGSVLQGVTEDKLLFYACETALQLHIVEMDEHLREIYISAYSLPKPSAVLQQSVTGKIEGLFRDDLPDLETRDFYLLEIATGGIMRGFMTIPCNIWFTMDMKTEAFLKNTLRLYYVPEERIQEAVAFVHSLDLRQIARRTIDGIFQYLEQQKELLS